MTQLPEFGWNWNWNGRVPEQRRDAQPKLLPYPCIDFADQTDQTDQYLQNTHGFNRFYGKSGSVCVPAPDQPVRKLTNSALGARDFVKTGRWIL